MSEKEEKRMIADTSYEVRHSIHIGDCEILVAENMSEPNGDYYLVANYRDYGILGEYSLGMASSDYLEIMREFTGRLDKQIDAINSRIEKADFQKGPITPKDCHPNDYSQSIDGKVVAIRADVLRPEHRRGDIQLVLVDGGHGSQANARGRAVFCRHLNNGEHTRFDRYDVQGEIKVLPDWAKERLAEIMAEKEAKKQSQTEQQTPEKVGNYTITHRITVGETRFALGENPKAPSPFATWRGHEGRPGYDLGHYFTTRQAAEYDLRNRASMERENNTPDGAYKAKARDEAR